MAPVTLLWLTFGLPLAGGVAALIADAWSRRRLAVIAAALGMAAGGLVALWAGWAVTPAPVYDVLMVGRAFSTIPGVVLLLAALVTAAGVRESGSRESVSAGLVALGATGAGLAAASIDLTTLLLSLETAAACGYALVALARTAPAAEAAMKYLIQGAVATGVALLGLAGLLGATAHSGRYAELVPAIRELDPAASSPALLGAVLIAAALAFKASAAPFHSWAPDAYQTAPARNAAFLAAGPKLAAIAALSLFVAAFGPAGTSETSPLGVLGGDLLPLVGLLGAVSVAVGSVAALRQGSYARMLGYAGVAQAGYALIALSAVNASAALILGVTYAVATAGAFLGGEALRTARPDWDGSIEGLGGLGSRAKLASLAVTLCMVSLAGLPPLAGFWGKFQSIGAVIYAARDAAGAQMASLAWYYGILAFVAIAGSVVSLAYYGSVLSSLYFGGGEGASGADRAAGDDPDGAGEDVREASYYPAAAALALVAAGVAPLVVGLVPAVQGFLLN